MSKDKKVAQRNAGTTGEGRISEAKLFLNSLLLGFVGIGLGMLTLRHKTRKTYFVIGVPLTAIYNIALFFLLKEKLEEDFGWQFFMDLPVF